MSLPRGIRNNNPGNIEKGDDWKGLEADQSGDERFCVFKLPEWGIRAIARILITYQTKHKLRTVREMIDRWAPPVENDTGSYAAHVASRLGVGPDDPVNVRDWRTMRELVTAIIQHENGVQPYPNATVDKGLALAGLRERGAPGLRTPVV